MLDLRIKDLFFDRPKVQKAIGAAKRRALSKAGAFIRRSAKSSIKPARRMRLSEMFDDQRARYEVGGDLHGVQRPFAPSEPGQPPRSITGLLKKFILFGYDPGPESVVVGPAKLTKPGETPHVLEFGGTTVITGGPRRGKQAKVDARPFMNPALKKNLRVIPEAFRDSVRGGGGGGGG